MTKADKPVSRETHATVRDRGKDREVCVTIDRTTVTLRLKGTQQSQTILGGKQAMMRELSWD